MEGGRREVTDFVQSLLWLGALIAWQHGYRAEGGRRQVPFGLEPLTGVARDEYEIVQICRFLAMGVDVDPDAPAMGQG